MMRIRVDLQMKNREGFNMEEYSLDMFRETLQW